MAGVLPWDSWDYTWGEGIEIVDAYNRRENDRAKRRAVALYNAAVFLAQTVTAGGSVKPFQEVFPGFASDNENREQQMSDEAMFATVRALNAQLGGKEVR